MTVPYKRVLLKLSGEAIKGTREYGIDPQFLVYLVMKKSKQDWLLALKLPLLLVVEIFLEGWLLSKMGWTVLQLIIQVC